MAEGVHVWSNPALGWSKLTTFDLQQQFSPSCCHDGLKGRSSEAAPFFLFMGAEASGWQPRAAAPPQRPCLRCSGASMG